MRMAITTTTTLTTHIILDAIIRSSGVDYDGGTVRSRITMYSRIRDNEMRRHLPALVAQGLISQEKMVPQNNPRHISRMSDKNRANATKTIYRVTAKGYQWLRQQEEGQQYYRNRIASDHRS